MVGSITQRLAAPTPAYYLGKGKLEELALLKEQLGYDLVIFDDELAPAQQRNLEHTLGVKVIDRTALILDIFARRAQPAPGAAGNLPRGSARRGSEAPPTIE